MLRTPSMVILFSTGVRIYKREGQILITTCTQDRSLSFRGHQSKDADRFSSTRKVVVELKIRNKLLVLHKTITRIDVSRNTNTPHLIRLLKKKNKENSVNNFMVN